MVQYIWDSPGGGAGRWKRRHGGHYFDLRKWAGRLIVACALIFCGAILWRAAQFVRRPASPATAQNGSATPSERGSAANAARENAAMNSGAAGETNAAIPAASPWQTDALQSFAAGAHDATTGNITAAEMDLDRGAELLTEARARSEAAAPEFFAAGVEMLDRVLRGREQYARLAEHATLARIELAQLRSAQNEPAADSAGAQAGSEEIQPGGDASTKPKEPAGVTIYAPRSIAANETLDPAALGAAILDARMMPDASEILLPPSTREFADNVRVQNLRLEGAAQTLDGIHWSNVVFADTRVRYEGRGLDLAKVKFVRCTFGFPVDARGAKLADAIALGQTSISMEPSPPIDAAPSDLNP